MPGSKTFTSSTNLEFLEYSLLEEYQKQQKVSSMSRALNGVVEVAKICVSAIFSAFYSLREDFVKQIQCTKPDELWGLLASKVIVVCVLFFLCYLVASLLYSTAVFLLDALSNSRRSKRAQNRGKNTFRAITANLIMLAVSFEHKCYAYHKNEINITANSDEADAWMDLEIQYFLKSIIYFKCASERLNDAVPPKMNILDKEKVNIRYMESIGLDLILANIAISLGSLNRLQHFANSLHIDNAQEDFARLAQHISTTFYPSFAKDQQDQITELISDYNNKYIRVFDCKN